MPLLNSYADVIRDWESLLSSCKKNAELLSGMDPVIAPSAEPPWWSLQAGNEEAV